MAWELANVFTSPKLCHNPSDISGSRMPLFLEKAGRPCAKGGPARACPKGRAAPSGPFEKGACRRPACAGGRRARRILPARGLDKCQNMQYPTTIFLQRGACLCAAPPPAGEKTTSSKKTAMKKRVSALARMQREGHPAERPFAHPAEKAALELRGKTATGRFRYRAF